MSEISKTINDGHYSTDLKIKRSNSVVAQPPPQIPKHKLFSEKEANQKLQVIDTDIYQGRKKEEAKNDFNKSLYFKIFGGVVLATAGIAGFDKIKKFFRKS